MVAKPEYVRIGGAWVLKPRYVRKAGAWELIGLSVSPASATGYEFRTEPAPNTLSVTSNNVTASGAATYSWAYLSGNASITANSPSAAATTFTHAAVPKNTLVSAVFRVTGNTGDTADVTVNLEYATDI